MFELDSETGCDLAVRIDDFVDAHFNNKGFCTAIRK